MFMEERWAKSSMEKGKVQQGGVRGHLDQWWQDYQPIVWTPGVYIGVHLHWVLACHGPWGITRHPWEHILGGYPLD